MSGFRFQLVLPQAEWKAVEDVRAALELCARAAFRDPARAQRVAMIASELMENALKYGKAGTLELHIDADAKTCRVTALSAGERHDPDVERLLARVGELSAGDGRAAYLERLERLAANAPAIGQRTELGLPRVVYEARCTLAARVEGSTVCVEATTFEPGAALEGLEVAGRMEAAEVVGGDYYDVIHTAQGRSFIAVGDVSGHGVTSGLTMMMARASLLGVVEADPRASLAQIYRALNRCLRANLSRMGKDLYMTFALAESLGGGVFRAVGNHLPLLVFRRARGEVEEISLSGLWLGVVDDVPEASLDEARIELSEGDLLVLYTDGLVEQFSKDDATMFGPARLKALVRGHGAEGPHSVVRAALEAVGGLAPSPADDVTILAIGRKGG